MSHGLTNTALALPPFTTDVSWSDKHRSGSVYLCHLYLCHQCDIGREVENYTSSPLTQHQDMTLEVRQDMMLL